MVEVQLLQSRNNHSCYRAGGIRTRGLLHPRQALYQAEPQPELIVVLERKHSTRNYFAYSGRSGKVE